MEYIVIFERGDKGYGAYVPDLPGCVAVGETREEAAQLIREAVREVCARFPDEYWAELDQSHTFPWEFYATMAKGGFIASAARRSSSSGGTSSMCVAIHHSLPAKSFTPPLRSP